MSCIPDILKAARLHSMFSPGDRVLVAVSGGPDSVAMLHALHLCAEELGIILHVAHFNHCLRGAESDEDERFVIELANALKLPYKTGRAEVRSYRKNAKLGEEEAARQLRYNFLQYSLSELGCNKLAVGHTADDKAETILLNILRGTGLDGLACMRPIAGHVVRPLIETWRTEIIEYLLKNGLAHRIDSSNLDTSYVRNRIRLQLVPLLEKDYNPQIKHALIRIGKIAERSVEAMEYFASQTALAVEYGSALDARLASDLLPGLAAEVIRAEIQRVRGDLKDVTYEHVEQILAGILQGEDFAIELPGGDISVEKLGNDIRIGPREAYERAEPFEIDLAVPGCTNIPALGITIETQLLDKVRVLRVKPNVALLDADKVRGRLRIRNAKPGDRIQPFGMTGTKKLQDVFVDKKIPPGERSQAAVVVDDERVLWVVGVTASEEARVTETTCRVIRLIAAPDQ